MSSITENDAATGLEDPLLQAEGIKKYFGTNTGLFDQMFGEKKYVKAVNGVDISVGHKETLGLVGESGCGKTTLGRVLARLYDPTAGTLTFEGNDITKLKDKPLQRLRKDVQVIFQDPLSSLNPRKTAGEIVGKPMEVHDIATGQEKRDQVAKLFEEVGLQRSHLDRYPHEFSGGQRQRIGIARALAVEPKLIIADEPVSALDVSVQAQIINLMKRLQQEYSLSYLVIAHDLSVVKHISDRVAVMYLGEIVEQGPTEKLYGHPQHPYTRALLNSIPSVEGKRMTQDHEELLKGNPPSPTDPPSGCPFHTRCPEFIGDECVESEPPLASVADSPGLINTTDAENDTEATTDEDELGDQAHIAACHWLDHSAEERRRQDPFQNS